MAAVKKQSSKKKTTPVHATSRKIMAMVWIFTILCIVFAVVAFCQYR